MKKQRWIFFAISVALLGAGCRKVYKGTEIYDLIKTTSNAAISKHDFTICDALPVEAFSENQNEPWSPFAVPPRPSCYWKYVHQIQDPAVCDALEKLTDNGYHSGSDCFQYLAQAKNDVALCGKATNKKAILNCEAKISKTIDPCYNIEKDDYDTTLYSRGVQYCISSVAARLRSFDPCLKIDGLNYGKQWQVGRNECIENVASILKMKPPALQSACQRMVDDLEGFPIKERCLKGEITAGVEQLIPPIGDGLGL